MQQHIENIHYMHVASMARQQWYTPEAAGLYIPKLHDARHTKFDLTLQYNDTKTLDEYIVQEKLDGNLFLFSGSEIYTKGRNSYALDSVPVWWQRLAFPNMPLLGEFYIGCYAQHNIQTMYVYKHIDDPMWHKAKYIVYDIPGLELPYSRRLELLQKTVLNWNKQICRYHQLDYETHHLRLPLQIIASHPAVLWRELFVEVLEQPEHRSKPPWGDTTSTESRTPFVLDTNLAPGEGIVFYHKNAKWRPDDKDTSAYIKLKPVIAIPAIVAETPKPNSVWMRQWLSTGLSAAVVGQEAIRERHDDKHDMRRSKLPGWSVKVRYFDPVNGKHSYASAFATNQMPETAQRDFVMGNIVMLQFVGRDWHTGTLTGPVVFANLRRRKQQTLLACIRANASQIPNYAELNGLLHQSYSSNPTTEKIGSRFIHDDTAVLRHLLMLHTVLPASPAIQFPFTNLLLWAGQRSDWR